MHKPRSYNELLYAIDGIYDNFNGEFKFQNVTHANTVKQYEVWLDNLVQQ